MQEAFEYDIVKNVNTDSPYNGKCGLVLQTSRKGAYVMYYTYQERKKNTKEDDSKWEKFEDLELVGSLGQFEALVKGNAASASSTTSSSQSAAPIVIQRKPISQEDADKRSQAYNAARQKRIDAKQGMINSLSNNQILSYDSNNISADDQKVIDKIVNDFQKSVASGSWWGKSRKILGWPSYVVFTGNGKYKRNVLMAAAKADGASVLPQVQHKNRFNTYRNILVVSNKSGKEQSETTKLRLAKERGWSILSEDAYLKLLSLQDADIVDSICNAMKEAMK